jgi:hypothetical protein
MTDVTWAEAFNAVSNVYGVAFVIGILLLPFTWDSNKRRVPAFIKNCWMFVVIMVFGATIVAVGSKLLNIHPPVPEPTLEDRIEKLEERL